MTDIVMRLSLLCPAVNFEVHENGEYEYHPYEGCVKKKGHHVVPFLFLCILMLILKDLVVSFIHLNTVDIGDDGLHSCRTYRVVCGQIYE